MRVGPASVMGNRYVRRNDTRKVYFSDIKNLYGTSICQFLPTRKFAEIEFTERIGNGLLKLLSHAKDNSKNGSYMECNLGNPQNFVRKQNITFYCIKKKAIKTKDFQNRIVNQPLKHEPYEKIIMDRTNKRKNSLQYRDLKLYMKSAMNNEIVRCLFF